MKYIKGKTQIKSENEFPIPLKIKSEVVAPKIFFKYCHQVCLRNCCQFLNKNEVCN